MKTSALLGVVIFFLALALAIWARERFVAHCAEKPGAPGCFILGPVE